MHQRLSKKTALETILYEIDMVRHCARNIAEKKARNEASGDRHDRREYYLTLEGFLLHLRNLLGFFMSRKQEDTDIGINDPQQWSMRPVEQREYSDLMKSPREINQKYGTGDSTCYDQISKFLQHCTTHRHEQDRNWEVEQIFTDIEPLIDQFEHRFVSGSKPTMMAIRNTSHSTAPMRTTSAYISMTEPEKKE